VFVAKAQKRRLAQDAKKSNDEQKQQKERENAKEQFPSTWKLIDLQFSVPALCLYLSTNTAAADELSEERPLATLKVERLTGVYEQRPNDRSVLYRCGFFTVVTSSHVALSVHSLHLEDAAEAKDSSFRYILFSSKLQRNASTENVVVSTPAVRRLPSPLPSLTPHSAATTFIRPHVLAPRAIVREPQPVEEPAGVQGGRPAPPLWNCAHCYRLSRG
jgi:hypothetical protein